MGTLIAIIIFFWRDWVGIFKRENRILLWFILVGTIPGAIAGYFLNAYAETVLRAPVIIAATLIVFAIVLYLADQYGKRFDEIKHLSWAKAIFIGIAQAIAIIPGVSRSGITMSAGLLAGLKRTQAAKYSFMLAAPIMLGAGIFKADEIYNQGFIEGNWLIIIVGFISALVAGILAIRFLLGLLQRTGFGIFIWYRIILAIVILLLVFYKG